MSRLKREYESVKYYLSNYELAMINSDYYSDGIDFCSSITRSCFEEFK